MRMLLIPAAMLIAAAPGFAAPKDDVPVGQAVSREVLLCDLAVWHAVPLNIAVLNISNSKKTWVKGPQALDQFRAGTCYGFGFCPQGFP